MFSPSTNPIITAAVPQAASTIADVSDAICLKDAAGVLIVVQHSGTTDNDVTLTVHEGATATEAAAGTYAVSATFPIWSNVAVAGTDAFTRETDAASYTIDSNLGGSYLICMYIDASILTAGRPWIQLGTDAGHGSNFFSAIYIIDGPRYAKASFPTYIA
jgi:hypothetical protein